MTEKKIKITDNCPNCRKLLTIFESICPDCGANLDNKTFEQTLTETEIIELGGN
jgi:predicted amidophosphoribosyltransferase